MKMMKTGLHIPARACMDISKYWRGGLLAVLFLTAVLCGCQKEVEKVPETIHYRLKWLLKVSVAGDIRADVRGEFAQRGLDVRVKPGGPERDAIKELELGHAQFGVASADQVIRALSKGSPIVVIAQLFRVNPLQWLYRPDKVRIESVENLRGKVIGVTFGGNDETIMNALLSKAGISKEEVTLFSVRYDYTPFYQGRVDLWPVYRNAQGVLIGKKLKNSGEPVAYFDPHGAGIRFVANSVVTTQAMIQHHPRLVENFLDALMTGWIEALDPENSQETIEMLSRFDQDTPADILGEQLDATRKLMVPDGPWETVKKRFGKIDPAAWEETEKIMLSQNLIPSPVHVTERLFKQMIRKENP